MASTFTTDKLHSAIKNHKMLEDNKSILVGFSGGADSTLLLYLLSQIDGITVAAAHLNHGIRGDEAYRDEFFCRRYCEENNITLFVQRSDVPSEAKRLGMTVEEAARKVRYDFFEALCSEHGYDLIATAHNADDNLETVLFHMVRGTALEGLCGIPPKRDGIIRPLIYYSKSEVLDACRELKIPYVTDSTNDDNKYTRNRIRNTVIPHLKSLNPSLCDSVTSMIDSLTKDRDYLTERSKEFTFDYGRAALSVLDDAILSRTIICELKRKGISPEKVHVKAISDAIRSDSAHKTVSVEGAEVICDRDLIYVGKSAPNEAFSFPFAKGVTVIDDNSALLILDSDDLPTKEIESMKNIYSFSIQATIKSDRINDGVVIRSRMNGDKYRINGMTKKVKKLIQSLKLPKSFTDNIPFIADGEDILYIPFFRPSDGCESSADSKGVRVIYFYNTSLEQEKRK